MSVSRNSTIPLNEVPAGASATVSEIRGGGNFLSRLATLGFTPGAQLAMIQNFGHGPLIVTFAIHASRWGEEKRQRSWLWPTGFRPEREIHNQRLDPA
jgi:Fe2+ transport system protein FeoA